MMKDEYRKELVEIVNEEYKDIGDEEENEADKSDEKLSNISVLRSKSVKSFFQKLGKDSKKLFRNSLSAVRLYVTLKKDKRIENIPEDREDSKIENQNVLEEQTGKAENYLNNNRIEFKVPYYFEEYSLDRNNDSDNIDDKLKDDYFDSKLFQNARLFALGYELEDSIGGGTHGSVFSAIPTRQNFNRKYRKVAIKICPMRKELTSFLEACIMEAYIMRKLSKICAFLTPASRAFFYTLKVDQYSSSYFYLIMPQATASLQEVITENGPLGEAGACQNLAYISRGLQYLHSQGIAHRDLKLANVLMTVTSSATTIQLTDFGMSLMASSLETGKDSIMKAGGTLSYMAPELMDSYIKFREGNRERAVAYDPFPVDVWAAGVCFYVMLYGGPPFGKQPPGKEWKIEHAKRMLWSILQADGETWRESLGSDLDGVRLSERAKILLVGLLEPGIGKRLTMREVLNVCILRRFFPDEF